MKNRPLGVTLYAVLFLLLYVLVMLPVGMSILSHTPQAGEEMPLAIALLVTCGALGLYLALTGVGLLMLKAWGRWLALLSAFISIAWIVVAIIAIFHREKPARPFNLFLNSLLVLAWNGVMVGYLLRPGVKAQFVKTATSDK